MTELLKRGDVWYSNFHIRTYGSDGEVLRDDRGRVVYTKIRRALDTDKELANEKLSGLLKIRREADEQNVPFQTLYRSRGSGPDGSWQRFKDDHLNKRKLGFKHQTYAHDERALRKLEEAAKTLDPPVLITKISQVTPQLLDDVKNAWMQAGTKPSAVNRALRSIKQTMRRAAAFGQVPAQDWTVVQKMKGETDHRENFFTRVEVKKQLARMPGIYKTMAYLGNRNGRRIGEVYYLQWAGVDFKNDTIRNYKVDGWEPKSKASASAVPMPKDLRDYLWQLKKSAIDDWVLSRKDLPSLLGMGEYFGRLLRKMKIKKGSAHTCRHTFASHLVQEGVDLYVVSKLMRHSSIRQTERYAHLRPPDLTAGIARLPKV